MTNARTASERGAVQDLRIGISALLVIGLLHGGPTSDAVRIPARIQATDEQRDELREFFEKYIGLSEDQIKAIIRGQRNFPGRQSTSS